MLMLSVFLQNIVDMIVDYALWVAVLKKEFSKITEDRLVARGQMTVVAITEGADEVYFVLSWGDGIPFRVETCESFLSVDGCHESVVVITCDKNAQKRNCTVLFKSNSKFNIAMTAV